MIINIRGTHGSGKSTIVKRFLDKFEPEELGDNPKKPEGYELDLGLNRNLLVVGSYKTACGGCDGIQPYADIWPRVLDYSNYGHVLFEGALVSSSYGNIGRASEQFGNEFVFAFLDTPLDVCLERIVERRRKRGNTKPLDPKNTEHKYNSIQKSINKIQNEFNRRVEIVDYKNAYEQILRMFQNGD